MKIQTLALVVLLAVPTAAADTPNPNPTDKPEPQKDKDKDKDTSASKLSDGDTAILAHVHHVNQMEIELGKLAQSRGTAAVKRYAEQLVRDHETADKEGMAFAKKHGLAKIPADKPVTAAEQQEMKDMMEQETKLKALKGADFDRMYLQMMADGHDKELGRSDALIAQATDPDLKSMLESRKTMLQRHADGAKELLKGNAQANREPPK